MMMTAPIRVATPVRITLVNATKAGRSILGMTRSAVRAMTIPSVIRMVVRRAMLPAVAALRGTMLGNRVRCATNTTAMEALG